MIINVGSKNPVKVLAVKETVQGAMNRLKTPSRIAISVLV